jgi:hypothetical protein
LTPEVDATTVVSGVVTNRTFLGSSVRYSIGALGQNLIVSTTNLRLAAGIGAGDPVRVGWDPDEAQLLASPS